MKTNKRGAGNGVAGSHSEMPFCFAPSAFGAKQKEEREVGCGGGASPRAVASAALP